MTIMNFINPFYKKKKDSQDASLALLQNFKGKSTYAESFRTLRTNLHFATMEKELESLLVTSAVQGEGKSNTVANLAYTIAQAGKTVLMIDADLRKPGLSKRFASETKKGLSTLISEVLGQRLVSGNIADYGLLDILKLCSLQQRTCILDLTDDDNLASLFLVKGRVVDIYWKNRPESKKLASTLIKEKLLTPEEARLALGHQRKSVRRLGSILLNMGLVEESELQKILGIHAMEAFRITTEMINGKFSFRPLNREAAEYTKEQPLNFEELYEEYIIEGESDSYLKREIDKTIVKTGQQNLYLLPSGEIPPNPTDIIGSKKAQYLLTRLMEIYDMVIIDSSPVVPASDALLLASQVDGVLLVVKAGEVNRKVVKDVTEQLKTTQANLLGITLNRADESDKGYYEYYRAYYGEDQ